MFHVGLDVHLKYTTVCVLDENGKINRRCTLQSIMEVVELLKSLPGPCQVCFEASTGYGFIFDLLSSVAQHVAVAHPGLLRLIFQSRKKNDRADAQKLAKLLYIGEVPSVHVPFFTTSTWRKPVSPWEFPTFVHYCWHRNSNLLAGRWHAVLSGTMESSSLDF